ncbi:MAG: response regulator, partial [Moorea sp. SIO3I7]|nr:response regulator [Moorena sp. SIO3I7]
MSAKLLLVDDEPGVREAVKEYLAEFGFTVDVASNANDAWQMLQQSTPELVISDIMMPKVDGYQFLQQLRDDPRFKALPVVFLTARGMTSDRIQGYQAGCDAYLPKPFDPDELVAIVQNLLERRAANSEDSVGSTELEKIAKQVAEIRAMLD